MGTLTLVYARVDGAMRLRGGGGFQREITRRYGSRFSPLRPQTFLARPGEALRRHPTAKHGLI
jgi:hypothetical protein